MSTAISGLNTTLYCGDSATALTKLCDIKDVPDLISEPNLLDLRNPPTQFFYLIRTLRVLQFLPN